MINYDFVRGALRATGAVIVVLFCCTMGAFAQSQSETHESTTTAQTINMKDTSLKAAINAVGKQLGLNIVYDEAIRENDKLTIELKDVSFKQALKIFLVAKR